MGVEPVKLLINKQSQSTQAVNNNDVAPIFSAEQSNQATKVTPLKQAKLIVQYNESISEIARLVLQGRGKKFDYGDILKEVENIKAANMKSLDATGNGFIVGSEIIVDGKIDVSKRKKADTQVYDYVYDANSQKIKKISDKYNLLNKNIPQTVAVKRAKELLNKFNKEYGKLDSDSMEMLKVESLSREGGRYSKLILSRSQDVHDRTSATYPKNFKIENNRELAELSQGVKKYKAADCLTRSYLVQKIALENNLKSNIIYYYEDEQIGRNHAAVVYE